jgi:hypothetical protein
MTPQDAIRRAYWSIKVPAIAAFVGPILAYVVLAKLDRLPSFGIEGLKWAGPLFILGFVSSWLIWSIQVPRWRLLAYREVDDIVELKRLAVEGQLIWPDGHFLERTEIASAKMREQIKTLENNKSNGSHN